MYLQLIFYTGQNILMLYVIIAALNIYFKPKKQIVHRPLTYSVYMILGVVSNFLLATPWINVILSVILIYILLTNYVGSMKSKIGMSCLLTMITMINEVIVTMTAVALLGKTINDVIFDESISFILIISHTLMLLIMVKVLSLHKKKTQSEETFMVFNSLYVCIIPLCSICILYFFIISLTYTISHYVTILVCIVIIFMNISFFVLFDKLRSLEKMKYEYAVLKSEAETFSRLEKNANDTFEKIRTIKHNLKYHLLYLKAKTEDKSLESLEDIGNVLDTLIEDTLSDPLIEYTKNKSINRLLNYKLLSLKERGIEVDIKVAINEDTYVDEVSLYTIIGNALDNAIRNFDSSNSALNSIIVRIISDGDNLFIKVANPYNKKLNFKNGLPVTDKRNEELHGIGLNSIKDLVESKNGHLKVTSNDNIFNLEIILYEEIKYKHGCQD